MNKKQIRGIAILVAFALIIGAVGVGIRIFRQREEEQARQERIAESVAESIAESEEESRAESIAESIAESEEESRAESIAESIAESEEESRAESVAASIAESEEESRAESVAASIAESEEESRAESIAESIAESEEESRAESVAASIAESEEESRAESAAASAAESEEASRQAQERLQQQLQSVDGKTIYLTFDDGPSYLTEQVLDTLDTYGAKATFFVTYQPEYEEMYKEIVRRGHAIGIHTSTHAYKQVYASYDSWLEDFTKVYDYVYQVTGVHAQVYRFPGGSCGSYCKANTDLRAQAISYLHSLGIEYFDWNVSCGDGGVVNAEQVYSNVISTVTPRTLPVVLMHDGANKDTTAEALPDLLAELVRKGYTFGTLSPEVAPIQQGVHWDY
jgi:peptidoglycan/xylan/chitin deacetylase (PgdA/CDA1 family)